MISIKNNIDCCGCNACGDVCAHGAITFKTDIEGFWYPVVDETKCVDCRLCERVCPELHIGELKKNDNNPPVTVAAINKNMAVRWDSTSGGAFSALAEVMYEQGGYVSGAVYDENFLVHNFVSDKPEDLSRLRSSKYLQSNAEGLYVRIRELLRNGKKVLACGTPCQMAALRLFLHKDYDNLVIVDFICRGVNSPKVYRKYLDSLERKYGGKVVYVKAKNKELGWRNLTRKVVFDNGKVYYGVKMDDNFRRGYHTNVFCRPSCYTCQYKGFPRIADITIADYWGIEKINKNLDNNIGTSMILLNSKKGENFFGQVKDKIEWEYTTFESILPGNVALTKPIEPAKIDRRQFFEDLDKGTFDEVVSKYFPLKTNADLSFRQKLKGILKPYYGLYQYLGFSPKAYINFLKLNYRKNTESDWMSGHVIYTMPSSTFDIHPSAKIIIKASLLYGKNPVKGMRIPTCLRMEANTTLEIHDGPLTRYGTMPYNLRYGAYIEIVNGGRLTIGQGAANVGLTIMCAKEVTIGNGVRIGRNVSIRDWNGSHVIINDHYRNHAPVRIEDHVWLCTGCTIMPGVTVGEGSVVAANATVTKDVPPHSLVGGSPAKVIKENIEWY
ncbi:Coenzyme F420 hydrogenase/dehydrogenase, beta subunit C-terminal domain [Paraprevotella clara]|uniref:4Fe-4S binding domain protein n=1 Tax=Paraprevotella clara YIT 11840 TaxID=762968 RepID=G5SQK9_9BACT|nr:Coenzyme F420 hydrogenase/dehydrogenase, beta subunit C-terminal domain [Paraprevotella clara]EHH00412.1 4Fe-4S binding domain protein [Paraprevotella clara YIT 11840]